MTQPEGYPPVSPAPTPQQPAAHYPVQPYPAPGPGGYPYPPQQFVHVTMTQPKNPGLAALLAGLFGPLGMLYATVPGAMILFGVNMVLMFVGFLTGGMGFVLMFFSWIGGMVWAYTAANQANQAVIALPPYPPRC